MIDTTQIEQYHRDGYLIVRNLYDADAIARWRDEVRQLYSQDDAPNDHGVRVWMADALPPFLLDAMTDDRVPPILTKLVGPDVEFLSVKLVHKDGAIDFGTPWHQDWHYWLGSEKLSVWIALDDATPDNGCLKVIPGSHKRQFTNQRHETASFSNRIDDAQLEGLPVVDAIMRRGDALFFSDRTVHGSYPNGNGQPRWSFISTYRSAAVRDDSQVWQTPLVVAGRSVNIASA
jgi:ectoine hydroxylase-related dioxygenase (phytanoyl-CoA dioxygenase family)